ncbi:MAG: hypothetical protein JWM80_1998 [Cyanobacteria bacterium RYN_339]|nr:hypothetical protein [Cyanobacteria bacterium RYN_339]
MDEHQDVAERFFAAIAAQDEAAVGALTYPESGFALVYDMWGWPGLRLYSTGDGEVPAPKVTAVTPMQDGMAGIEVRWDAPEGQRGATLYGRRGDDGWRLFDLRPTFGDYTASAFMEAEQRGIRLPWRGDAPDPVEQKIRNAVAARKATLDRQRGHVHYWRMVRGNEATADRSQPEAWAAAVDAVFTAHEGRTPQLNDVANSYGAKKATVKARMETLEQLLPKMRRVEH